MQHVSWERCCFDTLVYVVNMIQMIYHILIVGVAYICMCMHILYMCLCVRMHDCVSNVVMYIYFLYNYVYLLFMLCILYYIVFRCRITFFTRQVLFQSFSQLVSKHTQRAQHSRVYVHFMHVHVHACRHTCALGHGMMEDFTCFTAVLCCTRYMQSLYCLSTWIATCNLGPSMQLTGPWLQRALVKSTEVHSNTLSLEVPSLCWQWEGSSSHWLYSGR